MKNNNRKSCFECAACSFSCPNDICDLYEDLYGLPCSEVGLVRVSCRDCYYNSGKCIDCVFVSTPDCPDPMHRLFIDRG